MKVMKNGYWDADDTIAAICIIIGILIALPIGCLICDIMIV